MGRRKPRTLLQLAVARAGLIKGPRAVSVIVAWIIAEEMLGHPPTLEEYAEWWKLSRATAFRDQAVFRECFPGESTPQRVIDLIKAERKDREWRRAGVKGIGSLRIEGLGGAAA